MVWKGQAHTHSNYSEAIQITGFIRRNPSNMAKGIEMFHWSLAVCGFFSRVLRFWTRRANFSRLPCVFVGPASKGIPTPIASLLRPSMVASADLTTKSVERKGV